MKHRENIASREKQNIFMDNKITFYLVTSQINALPNKKYFAREKER
ncbi:hypothetical protein [Pantoea sp. CCBC3-3-1]|nr:hypothetical protein [Pantoea sp. CCBC3-3-1]